MPAITVRIKLHLSSGYKNKCELIEVEKKAISDNGNADMEAYCKEDVSDAGENETKDDAVADNPVLCDKAEWIANKLSEYGA